MIQLNANKSPAPLKPNAVANVRTTQTDMRSVIMKEISNLQEDLRGLYEKLNSVPRDAAHIDMFLALQNQIKAIEDEIHALQNLLQTEEANKKVSVVEVEPAAETAEAADKPGQADTASRAAAAPRTRLSRPAADPTYQSDGAGPDAAPATGANVDTVA